jgi:hypothetical protein
MLCILPVDELRKVFQTVRDIPYAAQYDLFKDDQRLLTQFGLGCSQKAKRLRTLFANYGVNAELRHVAFRWCDVLERLPDVPLKLVEAASWLRPRWHVFLSVKFGRKAIIVDPTWDMKLRHTGLPVNDDLTLENDMHLAVPQMQVPLNASSRIDDAYESLPVHGTSLILHKHYYVFVLQFNRWLSRQRDRDR